MIKWLFKDKSLAKQQAKPTAATTDLRSSAAKELADFLQIVEVNDASPFVAPLFRRRFGGEPPNFPRHFVALYRNEEEQWQPLGYVHFTRYGNDYLCGGLVMDERRYRRVSEEHRQRIAQLGGVAELLLREGFNFLGDFDTIWGYVGDKQSERVILRVGFEHTEHPYIMAVWKKPFSAEVKRQKVQLIAELGAF